jgi:hypothetical protein
MPLCSPGQRRAGDPGQSSHILSLQLSRAQLASFNLLHNPFESLKAALPIRIAAELISGIHVEARSLTGRQNCFLQVRWGKALEGEVAWLVFEGR